MELRQLRYFVAVSHEGSLSKAALKVHIAQPALSRQIQMLEDELEVDLLNRSAKGVELTAAGQLLCQMAESILDGVGRIKPAMQTLKGLPAGDVSIGISPSLMPVIAEPLLAMCAEKYPAITLRLVEGLSMFLNVWLEQSKLDLAIYTSQGERPGTNELELAAEEVLVVGAPKFLSSFEYEISSAEVAKLPLTLTPSFRARMLLRFQHDSVPDPRAREIDSVDTVKDMVTQGICCSILPYSFVREEISKGDLIALHFAGELLTRKIVIVTKANSSANFATQKASDLLRVILHALPTLP